MFRLFILVWGIINLLLAIFSVFKIRKNKEKVDFIYYWGFLNGSFVYEDMFVFGLLHSGIAFVSLFLENDFIWLIGFLIFWIVRSGGETIYYFLQQFIVPQHHPHNIDEQFRSIRRLFGNISFQKCTIIMQVLMQSILVISLLILICILKNIINL